MKNKFLFFFRFIKQVITEFIADNVLKYSASLAYYTVLALAPLLVIVLFTSSVFFGKAAMSGELYTEIKGMVGNEAATQIQGAIQNIHLSKDNFVATGIGATILLVSATGIFGEMQDSLNRIWGLRIKSRKVWWKLILDRLISFSLILSLGFVLIVSLALNALVAILSAKIDKLVSGMGDTFIYVIDNFISVAITTLLFATIFKVLPDAKIRWKDVLVGAFITALLFMLGKYGIGFYLGKSKLATIYGAAGSVMIIMIWVYYSAAILYLGAVFTKVYATNFGGKIYPSEYSVWIKVEEIPVEEVTLH